jgi:hypothetical protein
MSIASARSAMVVDRFCPEGVGVRLADDLARSVSKPCERCATDTPSCLMLLPVPGSSRG